MKKVLITGATSGIGSLTALSLSRNDYEVIVTGRNKEKMVQLQEEIKSNGGQVQSYVSDLSKVDEVEKLIVEIKNKNSELHLIANIAGIWHGANEVYAGINYGDFDSQILLNTINVGIVAPMLLVKGLLPRMPAGSKIINLSGTFENGGKGWLPYFVSKRALEDFTVGLADELRDKDIQVNSISPSDTATEQYAKYFPEYVNESIDPQLIADKFVELAHEENLETGKIIVMKKDKEPIEGFHQ